MIRGEKMVGVREPRAYFVERAAKRANSRSPHHNPAKLGRNLDAIAEIDSGSPVFVGCNLAELDPEPDGAGGWRGVLVDVPVGTRFVSCNLMNRRVPAGCVVIGGLTCVVKRGLPSLIGRRRTVLCEQIGRYVDGVFESDPRPLARRSYVQTETTPSRERGA